MKFKCLAARPEHAEGQRLIFCNLSRALESGPKPVLCLPVIDANYKPSNRRNDSY